MGPEGAASATSELRGGIEYLEAGDRRQNGDGITSNEPVDVFECLPSGIAGDQNLRRQAGERAVENETQALLRAN
jgi:hypothetical protein